MKKSLISFAGNQLGDSVRVGNIFNFQFTQDTTNYPNLAGYTQGASSSAGALTTTQGLMQFVPMREPGLGPTPAGPANGAAASLMTQQIIPGNGPLPLIGLTPGSTPTAGFFLDTVRGFPMIRLDNPRSLLLAVIGSVGTPSTAFNISVSGADFWGNLMTYTVIVPAGLTAVTYFELPKSFAYVKSAQSTATSTVPVWLGVGGSFGMDYYTPMRSLLTRAVYAATELNITASAVNTTGTPQSPCFTTPPVIGLAPLATQSDIRGLISVFSGPVPTIPGNFITGVNTLTVQYVIYGTTAQAENVYNPLLNKWTSADENTRVLNLLGNPQFYNATLA